MYTIKEYLDRWNKNSLKIEGFKGILLLGKLDASYISWVSGIQNECIKWETFLGGIMVTFFYFLSKRRTTVDTKLWNELTFKARRSFSKECPIKIASCGRRSIKHFWTSSNVVVTFSSVFFVMPLNLHKKRGETQVSIYTLNLKILEDFP